MRFDLIPPDALHSVWPYVKRGLERVREVSPERWLPEDLYAHLRIGRAHLYTGWHEERYLGFFITENKRDPFTNDAFVNVWVLFAEPQQGEHFADVGQFIKDTIAFIDTIALNAGAKWIAMDGRTGWQRMLKGYFEPVKVKYERMVEYV